MQSNTYSDIHVHGSNLKCVEVNIIINIMLNSIPLGVGSSKTETKNLRRSTCKTCKATNDSQMKSMHYSVTNSTTKTQMRGGQ